jgi:hypothetical protein
VRRALAIVCVAILAGSGVAAQSRWQLSFAASGGQEIARSRIGTTRERVSGMVFSGEGAATRGPFALRLRYGQGRVTNDTAGRDVAEAEALLGYEARPWLTVWFGPQARTFVVPGQSDRRWLLWSGRVTARGTLFPGRVSSFVELWQGVTGNLNRPAESVSGGGAEAGMEVRLARRPFWGRLGYRIEQGQAGTRRETVEAITLTIGVTPLR